IAVGFQRHSGGRHYSGGNCAPVGAARGAGPGAPARGGRPRILRSRAPRPLARAARRRPRPGPPAGPPRRTRVGGWCRAARPWPDSLCQTPSRSGSAMAECKAKRGPLQGPLVEERSGERGIFTIDGSFPGFLRILGGLFGSLLGGGRLLVAGLLFGGHDRLEL